MANKYFGNLLIAVALSGAVAESADAQPSRWPPSSVGAAAGSFEILGLMRVGGGQAECDEPTGDHRGCSNYLELFLLDTDEDADPGALVSGTSALSADVLSLGVGYRRFFLPFDNDSLAFTLGGGVGVYDVDFDDDLLQPPAVDGGTDFGAYVRGTFLVELGAPCCQQPASDRAAAAQSSSASRWFLEVGVSYHAVDASGFDLDFAHWSAGIRVFFDTH